MSETSGAPLLGAGVEVPFVEIERALRQQAGVAPDAARALTATVIVVGAQERLVEAAAALESLTGAGSVRAILMSEGDNPAPPARVLGPAFAAVAFIGLTPGYFNNAVAALRLSSLPVLVWWRGGRAESLDAVAELADRLVLDVEDPAGVWAQAGRLIERTALSDLRWTRLTRWRALMAHFFDIPDVRRAAPSFDRLEIAGGDLHAMRLFAGWLSSALGWQGQLSMDRREGPAAATLTRVRLSGPGLALELAVAPSGRCVQTTVCADGRADVLRMVAPGDHRLPALLAEELGVRSRDLAFEHALQALPEVA